MASSNSGSNSSNVNPAGGHRAAQAKAKAHPLGVPPTATAHPNVHRVYAAVARNPKLAAQYPSAAALCRACGLGSSKAAHYPVRQWLRNAGLGVGRGHRYNNPVPTLRKATRANNKAQAKQAKGAAQAVRSGQAAAQAAHAATAGATLAGPLAGNGKGPLA